MGDEGAFLRSVRDDPDDQATRLVFADWLEERGDARAEFVRLDTALRKMTGGESEFQKREDRWRELRNTLPREWLAAFGHLFTTEELNAAEGAWHQGIPFPEGGELLEFFPEDTHSTSHEVSMRIVRGKAASVRDGLEFWLRTLHGEMWGPRVIPDSGWPVCIALTEPSWRKATASRLSDLLTPPLPLYRGKEPFVAAVNVSGDWRCEAWLAAYRDEFIGVLWESTA
jgi:uncharacterized protein (TIGR02996 family)